MTLDTVEVTIGGERVAVPPLSFAALKRAWPSLKTLGREHDLIVQAEAMVAILAAALHRVRPELDAAEIEARLIGREFLALLEAAPQILAASGLGPDALPPQSGETAKPGKPQAGEFQTGEFQAGEFQTGEFQAGASPAGTISSPASSDLASAVGTRSRAA